MEIIQEIIKDYSNGLSISKLIKKYSYNRRQITKMLMENGIAIRGGRKKKELSNNQIEEIKKMINDGAFLKEIAEYCQLDKETTKQRLNALGLKIKNRNKVNKHIKSDFFTKIDNPIKAYWLGFLFTDGAVDHYKSTGRIRLQLQEQDKEILEKFKEDLGLECKIIYDKRINSVCCSVEFVDEQIFQDLSNYDIIQNKTYKVDRIPYDKIPKEFLSAFTLGLFDGDGNFYCDKYFSKDVCIGYTAYHRTEVEDFQYIINTLINTNTNTKIFFTSAWHVNWKGRLQVLKILDILYKDCPRHLERKYNLYLSLKNSLN